MPESLHTALLRLRLNWFPAYRGTGARLTYIASDWQTVRLCLPLTWRTRNYVGTIFGGSMYGAVDPIYMLMLLKTLGPEYTVWVKSAAIRFRKPGKTTLFAECRLPDEELSTIRTLADRDGKCVRVYPVALVDGAGEVHATVDTILHIRKGDAPLTEEVWTPPVAVAPEPEAAEETWPWDED